MRFVRFRNSLATLAAEAHPDVIAYEEVARHVATAAAHIYGGLVAVLQTLALSCEIEYVGIPVGTIKKHATGKGNANKDRMIEAALERWPDAAIVDDNEADARWCAETAFAEIGNDDEDETGKPRQGRK